MYEEKSGVAPVGIPTTARSVGGPDEKATTPDTEIERLRIAALEERVEHLRAELDSVVGERNALAAVLRIYAQSGNLSREQARSALARLGL